MAIDGSGVLPKPRKAVRRRGWLAAGGKGSIAWSGVRTPRLERAWRRASADLVGADARFDVRIDCRTESARYPALDENESYRLVVGGDGVAIEAASERGVLHALSTLRQLVRREKRGARLPLIDIDDGPRFPWRGLLLDPARRFLSIEALERTLDGMALAKLDVLHLHLTDDQGFRFAGRAFPELATATGGAYYTAGELRGLVEYAADRGIRVVPEIDMPGHCTSWLAAHPEWTSDGVRRPPSRRFGVQKACLDPSRQAVYDALEQLLADLADVFPDTYLHIGGDEVHPAWWSDNDEVQRYMASIGATDVHALQAHFNARVAAIVDKIGKRMIGWDEIVHPDLPAGTAVQSWRGAASRDRALDAGFDCVFSAGYYLDLFYPADLHYGFDPEAASSALADAEAALRSDRRLAHVRGGLGWATQFNAAAAGHDQRPRVAAERGRVLGGEACLWSELVAEHVLDVRLWDRLPAVAERLWSSASTTDADAMRRRTTRFRTVLRNCTAIDASPAGPLSKCGLSLRDQRLLRPLLDALESVKWYARLLGAEALRARIEGSTAPVTRPYDTTSALDRIIDALPVESASALRAEALISRMLDLDDGAARRSLAAMARGWIAQRARLVTIAERVVQCRELDDISADLVLLGELALRALDGKSQTSDMDAVKALTEPRGEYMLAVALPILRLVAARA